MHLEMKQQKKGFTGLVATTHMGDVVSLTGGYFNQTNFDNNDGGLGTSAIDGSESFCIRNWVQLRMLE